MAIKKKGLNSIETNRINKPNKETNKLSQLKSGQKSSVVRPSRNLRVTGETVSGVSDTISTSVQCDFTEERSYPEALTDNEQLNTARTDGFISDTDGFVVTSLIKDPSEVQQEQNQGAVTEDKIKSSSLIEKPVYPAHHLPTTAPRSSPIHEVECNSVIPNFKSEISLHQ